MTREFLLVAAWGLLWGQSLYIWLQLSPSNIKFGVGLIILSSLIAFAAWTLAVVKGWGEVLIAEGGY